MKKKNQKSKETPVKDSILESEKLQYGLGAFLSVPGNHAVKKMSYIIFNMVLGVNPILIGVASFIFRMWDAFTDPFMGSISDNSRFKMGRRKPFIIIGAVLSAITFPLIWFVPSGLSEMLTFSYFLVSCLIFYTAYTIFSVPYTTLAMEMSPGYNERTSVVAWRALFSKMSAIGMGWMFFFSQRSSDTLTGMRWVAIAMGVVFLVCGVIPGIFVKERFYKKTKKQKKIGFKKGLKLTFTTKPFMMLISMEILMVLGCQMINVLGPYLNVYYLHGGDKGLASIITGLNGTTGMICSILSIPVFTFLARKLGKVKALYINAGFMFFATICKWFLITPEHPYWMVINAALLGPGTTGIWVLMPSLMADISDWDEWRTGVRREGSFGSIYQWTLKFGASIAMLCSGLILTVTGFDSDLGGAQSPNTLLWMRILFMGIPATATFGILVILFFYPLNEDMADDIRAKLEARRGEI